MPSRIKHGLILSLAIIGLFLISSITSYSATNYVYDELNRLRFVQYEDGTIIEYTYDGAGNRLTLSVTGFQETVSAPSTPTGPSSGITGTIYTYTTGGSSTSLGHSVQYLFDWDDGTNSGWLPVGQTSASKSWSLGGNYSVKAQARCSIHNFVVSSWSESLLVAIIQPAGITVVSPNGGESWRRWRVYTIQWSYTGDPGAYVKIELLKGGVLNRVITNSTSIGSGGSGSYNWRVPLSQQLGSDYKIRVTSTSNGSYTDTSDNNFSITN